MEVFSRKSPLPDDWKEEFFRHNPIIPAIFQLGGALAMIIVACFGEVNAGIPWWAGSLFIMSAIFLCLLYFKQLIVMEMCAFVSMIISIIAATVGIIFYTVGFALLGDSRSPFTPSKTVEQFALALRVNGAVLGLISFELGVCVWSLNILIKARKKSRSPSGIFPLHI